MVKTLRVSRENTRLLDGNLRRIIDYDGFGGGILN